jgi:diaminopimelate epimerase
LKTLEFWKTQTVGNDFVLVHADAAIGLDLPGLAIELCARRFGVGSDGLLVVTPDGTDLHLRMFNPDGTEDFCGNGLRCAAFHAVQQGWVQREHRIEHFGRLVNAVVLPDGSAKTAIGPAVYDPEEVPLARDAPLVDEEVLGYRGTALNAGSTHFVTLVRNLPNDEEFFRIAPQIEMHPLFPERTSVIFVREAGVRLLEIRIWERGVGETLGCGTGSSAAAAEWMRRHGRSGDVEVQNPGGALIVSAESIGGSLVTQSKPQEPFRGWVNVSVRESSASRPASAR